MNMKTTKFLAVLAVFAMAFAGFAVVASGDNSDAAVTYDKKLGEFEISNSTAATEKITLTIKGQTTLNADIGSKSSTVTGYTLNTKVDTAYGGAKYTGTSVLKMNIPALSTLTSINGISVMQKSNAVAQLGTTDMSTHQVLDKEAKMMTSWFAKSTFASADDFEFLIPQDGTGVELTVTIYGSDFDLDNKTGTAIGTASFALNLKGVTTVVDLSADADVQSLKGNVSGGWAYADSGDVLTLNNFEGQVAFLGKITTVSLIGNNSLTVNLIDSSASATAAQTEVVSGVINAAIGAKTGMKIATAAGQTVGSSLVIENKGTGFGISVNSGDLTIGDKSDEGIYLSVAGGDRAIYAQKDMTISNAVIEASGSERVVHTHDGTITIADGSNVEVALDGNYVNVAGDDDVFGVKVGSNLTVNGGSTLATQGLRVKGTISLGLTENTSDPNLIYVAAGYTQNPKTDIKPVIAGFYADAHASALTISKVSAPSDEDTEGIYFIGDVDYYAPASDVTVNDTISGKTVIQKTISNASAEAGAIQAIVDAAVTASGAKEDVVVNITAALTNAQTITTSAGQNLELRTVGEGKVSATINLGAATGNDVVLTDFKGAASFTNGSIVMNVIEWDGGDITLSNGDVLKVSSTTAGITGNVTINGPTAKGESARILVESGQTLTVSGKLNLIGNLSMNNDGSIVGRGTIDVGENATFYTFTTVSVYLTGEGTIITEDSMEDVEISGYLTSSMKATPTQRVIVTGNLTIRAGEYLVITGELVVPEGVTVSIEEGGLLMLTNPTAHAEIYGTIKASGKSAVAVADYNSKAAFTVASDANKVPVVIYGSIIAAKATADNVTSVDLKGLTEIYGDVTINTKAAANFAENAVVEATGKITVNGAFSGTISNEGLIEINGAVEYGTQINMAATDAVVDVKALKGTEVLTITDLGMYLMTDGEPIYVTEDDDNTITLQNVGGVYIEEDIIITLDAYGVRDATNYTYLSGTTGFGDSKVAEIPSINITEGETVVVAEELNLIKTVLNIAGDVTVSGKATVNTEETFVLYGETTPRHADIVISDGETIVTGMIQVTGNSLAPTTEDNMVAVKYTNRVDLKDVYYYTTLKTAIASGEKDFEVLKRLLVLEDTTVPAGVIVDATGKIVTIGNEVYAPEATLVITDGANLTAATINVIGTLYIANVDTGINCSNIVSDTSSFGEKDALYTNLYNALVQAESGDVVKITKKDNEVYLNKNSVIKTGVTLTIPGSKTLKICEGVTLTVNGFLQNKGTISAYYIDADGNKQAGTFAEKAKADSTTHAASIKVSGMIESTTSMPYDNYKIPGAYYTSKTMYYITTVDAAALVATTVDGCKIDLYGTLEIGDVSFIGTESKNLEINVYGTTAAKGTFTVGEMGIAYGAIKFKTAGTILNGTFGTATGSVKLANVETVGTENMISDYIFADGDETVSVMAIQGSLKHSTLDVDTKKATSFTFDGDVAVKSDLTLVGLYNSTNGTVKIADDAFMGIFDGAELKITDANVTIDGEVMVFDNGKMTVAKSAGTVPTVTVNGSFIAADGSDEDYDESGTVDVNAHVIVSDLAVVGGNVVPDLLTVMPTGTVIGTLLETITAPSAAYTEFYVEGDLWKTVYMVNSNADITLQKIQKHAAPDLEDCKQGMIATAFTEYIWAKTEGSSTAVTGDVGKASKVYAYIIYDIYKIQIYSDAGVKSVSIDNKVLSSPPSGENKFETIENLKAGEHKVTYTLKDGYEGEVVLYTADHTILKDLKFTTSGTDDYSYANGYLLVTLELSGTEPIPEPEPTPTPEEKSEWTVTTILLCILVVLIAIMAVIVALRLNRN